MKSSGRTWVTLLNLVLLVSLTLALPVPVMGQGPGGDDEGTPVVVEPQVPGTGEQIIAPASTPEPIDCNDPLPGEEALLIEDNEILVALTTDAGWDDSGWIQLVKLDNKSNDSSDLDFHWIWNNGGGERIDVIWPVITTADLDGDGKDEVISAYKDHAGRFQAVSLKNPEVASGSELTYDSWISTSHARQGQELNHFDIAAGNLNGWFGGDEADEVVVAFRDNDADLQVVVLNGASDGGLLSYTWWYSTNHGRGYVGDVSVDIGDLDGDGYDDEIVLAFADSDQDQQVVVLELRGDNNLHELGWEYWTSYDRGSIDLNYAAAVDVTAGNFDGAPGDEIAVAVRDGSGALQITQIVYDPDGDTLRARVNATGRWRDTGNHRGRVDFVSAGSGDIDDDGYDEIIVGFANSYNDLSMVTLDGESRTPRLRGSYSTDYGDYTKVRWVSVDAGDIDGDSKAEVVMALQDYGDDLQVISFDDNPACPCADDASSGLLVRDAWQDHGSGRGDAGMVWVALGDVDGDSIYGDYTGQCQQIDETRVSAMVIRPPYWQDQNQETEVGYGKKSEQDTETDNYTTNSYGSSVTADASFLLADIELGPSFTREWDHTLTQSSATGSSLEISWGSYGKNDGFVPINTVSYYAYQYQRRDGGGLTRVSVPVNTRDDSKYMNFWNRSDGARQLFPNSWFPAYRSGWMNDRIISESLGDSSQGAGADYYDINGNGKPDYLFAWIDNPAGENAIYYRIGWDASGNGNPVDWSATYQVPGGGGIGWENSGLGAAVTELNGNGAPELVVAWVAAATGDDWGAYYVGWDLGADGQASSWSKRKTIPGELGESTQGVGLDVVDISGDGRPEMFYGWIDNPSGVNRGYYRVGWNLDENGDSANWWTNHRPIEGAFGVLDAGLGLTVTDLDRSGQPDLVAAWVRDLEGQNEWAYAIGEELDGNAYVGSWVPGYGVPSWLLSRTGGAALASANLNQGDELPELVISWIDDPDGANRAWLQVGKSLAFGGEVDQRPTDLKDDDPDDGKFQIQLYGQWWNVNGKVLWRWDEIGGNTPSSIFVGQGSSGRSWSVDQTTFTAQSIETSQSYNYETGGEAEFLGIGVEGSSTYGFEQGTSYTLSWESGFYMDAHTDGVTSATREYAYVPFTYMQEAMSKTGIKQSYMVLDYFVPPSGMLGAVVTSEAPAAALGITPEVPLITSPSHPDPDTWYPNNTVVFTWMQPAGDPAVVDGYRWYLDHSPDTVLSGMSFGLTDTKTYEGVSDGLWYMHLRARGDGGDWSETAHRAVSLDVNPPRVELDPDPPLSIDNDGWYNSPVTLTIISTDTAAFGKPVGSGVQAVEYSTDGAAWQPYSAPLVLDSDTPLTTLWARAADLVGHVSEPVSITLGLDLTAPDPVEGPDCWEPGGNCVAGVFTDTVGNQYLQLSGEVDEGLSGMKGITIQISAANETAAAQVGEGTWSWVSAGEVGAGCHTFDVHAEDRAGNVELPHTFHTAIAWHPKEPPDLSGSSFSASPNQVRPGAMVTFTLSVPNSGWQETWVPIEVTLPSGLDVITDTIGAEGEYDPASRTISWPPRYLWPGDERQLTFGAQVNATHAPATLAIAGSAVGSWPIAGTCPPEALSAFLDLQRTVALTATVTVDPDLPADADKVPPTVLSLGIEQGVVTNSRDVQLRLNADGETQRMYLREWTWGENEGTWIVAHESGWLPYSASYPWTLSEGDGVKYLGVWVADAVWNVSTLESHSLAFTNLLESRQSLADGQRIQYRFPLGHRQLAVFNVVSHEGNADLYAWDPRSGFRPQYAATGTGFADAVGFEAFRQGLYLVEVKAEGDSVYELLLAGDIGSRGVSQLAATTPDHPLTVSDPLSAGAVSAPAPPDLPKHYLPIVMNGD